MSVTASSTPPTPTVDDEPRSARRFDLRDDIGLIVTPLVLGLVFVAYWTWLGTQELSSQAASALRTESLLRQTREQITITALSTIGVLLIAIPLGIGLTRPRGKRFASPALAVANAGQAIPAYGLLVLALAMLGRVFGRSQDNFLQNTIGTWLGPGLVITVFALILFAILPVLRNTMVGLQQVDQDVIEAGLGMGMTRREVLWRIELPLAVPVMLAGVRTALVINVGMATLAFLIGGGGLGVAIRTGIQLSQNIVVLTGGVLTALLALSVDWLGGVAERLLRPKGIRTAEHLHRLWAAPRTHVGGPPVGGPPTCRNDQASPIDSRYSRATSSYSRPLMSTSKFRATIVSLSSPFTIASAMATTCGSAASRTSSRNVYDRL